MKLAKTLAARFGQRGVLRNAAAMVYGNGTRMALQLISVPVFTYFWGLHDYGIWLLLFTVPSFLAMGDLGFNTAASNAIIVAAESGDEQAGADIFAATRLTMLGISAVLMALALLALLVRPELVAWVAQGGSPPAPTVLAVVAYGLVCVQSATTLAGFRSTGGYAEATFVVETVFLVEALAAFATVAMGGGLLQAALAYLVVRVCGTMLAAWLLRRHAPQLFVQRQRKVAAVMRDLAAPAIAVMALPVSNAITLQGAVAVIGAIGGPAIVPIFTATRTLSRFPMQLSLILTLSASPQITADWTRGDHARLDRLIGAVLAFSAAGLVVMLAILGVSGKWLVDLWTHGQIHPSGTLLGLLLASSLSYSLWMILSIFVLAINRQAIFSYFFLAASVACLGVTALLVDRWGVEGAAAAALLLDLVMLAWLVRCTARLGLVRAATWRQVLSGHWFKQWRALLHGRASD